jgi:NADPH-dependent ferric siderophore reductase
METTPTEQSDSSIPEPDASRARSYWPLHKHCNRDEQRVLRALRFLSTDSSGREQAFRVFESIDISGRAISPFARLSLFLSSNTANIRLLGPESPFATTEELEVLAHLGRIIREDRHLEQTLPAGSERFLDALQRCGALLRNAGVYFPRRAAAPYRKRVLGDASTVDLVQRQDRWLRDVRVRRIIQVSPHLKRITFHGDCLADFTISRIAQWVKLFIPSGNSAYPCGRAYTARRHRIHDRELDIDFITGGSGPLSRWADNAQPGDLAQLAGPRGGYSIDPKTRRVLLIGDAAALPAFATFVENLRADTYADVFVEITHPDDLRALPNATQKIRTQGILREPECLPGTSLLAAIDKLSLLSVDATETWLFADALTTHAAQQNLMQRHGLATAHVHPVSYWKVGDAAYKDLRAG